MSWLPSLRTTGSADSSEDPLLPLPVTAGSSSASSSRTSHNHTPSYPPPPTSRSTLAKLTSKGKGKSPALGTSWGDDDDLERQGGRAGDLLGPEEDSPKRMAFGIRFTDGSQEDLAPLWVEPHETVRDVQRKIRLARPSLTLNGRPRRLRLIQLGRLLTDGIKLVPYARALLARRAKLVASQLEPTLPLIGELVTGAPTAAEKEWRAKAREREGRRRSLSGVGEEKGKGKEREREGEGEGGRRGSGGVGEGQAVEEEEEEVVWLHCSVGEPIEESEAQEEKEQTTQITPLQGFDRLRDAGFSDAEIASMREEFRASTGNTAPVDGDEDEHARALEDQWMEGLTGQNEAAADTSSSGVYTTLLQGVCIGFFVPFLPFFFFRTQLFSTRMQMAIVLGVGCNIVFALLRTFG